MSSAWSWLKSIKNLVHILWGMHVCLLQNIQTLALKWSVKWIQLLLWRRCQIEIIHGWAHYLVIHFLDGLISNCIILRLSTSRNYFFTYLELWIRKMRWTALSFIHLSKICSKYDLTWVLIPIYFLGHCLWEVVTDATFFLLVIPVNIVLFNVEKPINFNDVQLSMFGPVFHFIVFFSSS